MLAYSGRERLRRSAIVVLAYDPTTSQGRGDVTMDGMAITPAGPMGLATGINLQPTGGGNGSYLRSDSHELTARSQSPSRRLDAGP